MFRGNGIYKLASLLIAIALSIYVHSEQNPTFTRTLTLVLRERNRPAGILVQSMPNTVQVQLTGSRNSVLRIEPKDLEAALNFNGLEPGTHDMRVICGPAERASLPLDVTLTPIPESVPVVLEATASQTRTLEPVFLRPAPVGFTYGTPDVTPPVATITGPRNRVARVSHVQAVVDAGPEQSGVLTGQFPVQPMDSSGAPVPGVTARPSTAKVTCVIQRLPVEKEVLVSANVTGATAPGYHITAIKVNPGSIVVTGTADMLRQLNFVTTQSIDISNATSRVSRSASVALPGGVTARGAHRVKVEVDIAPRTQQ